MPNIHLTHQMMITVRVDVERHVRDEAARQLAAQGLTIGDTMRIVLEQAAAGCGPNFGALVPNPTTVAAIEAARRDRRARQPSRGTRRTQSGRLSPGPAGQPARAVGQAHDAIPARLQTREAGRARQPPGQDAARGPRTLGRRRAASRPLRRPSDEGPVCGLPRLPFAARPRARVQQARVRWAGACPHRFPRADRAVTHGEAGRIPCRRPQRPHDAGIRINVDHGARDGPARRVSERAVGAGAHRRRAHGTRGDVLRCPGGRGIPARIGVSCQEQMVCPV